METKYSERGYLKDEFKIFHLSGIPKKEVPFHYHDFMKIVILVSGNISYAIEGKQYELHPYDIVLVNAGEIHRPIVRDKEEYERIIIYISTDFLERYKDYNLEQCFQSRGKNRSHVIRYGTSGNSVSRKNIMELTSQVCETYHAGELLQKCRLIEFLILLNEVMLKGEPGYIGPMSQNKNILKIVDYIGNHITSEMSVNDIARAVHLNRSYLMHIFKAETGYTIKEYITEKRLFLANSLLKNTSSMTEVCYQSGFSNYSSFYRAYVAKYGHSPKSRKNEELLKAAEILE